MNFIRAVVFEYLAAFGTWLEEHSTRKACIYSCRYRARRNGWRL